MKIENWNDYLEGLKDIADENSRKAYQHDDSAYRKGYYMGQINLLTNIIALINKEDNHHA